MGHVITKAAVLRDSLDQGRYLLGNKTAALLEDYKMQEDVQIHMINAVQTRAQKKILEAENDVQGQYIEQFEELNDNISEDEKKNIEDVLPMVKEFSVQNLIKTSAKVFVEEQHQSEPLKPLIAEAKLNVSKENRYILGKNILFFKKRDKNGTERKLLVVPEKFREQLKTFCHEAELVHGRNLRTPMMLLYENLTEPCEEENSVVTYVFELMNRMKQCQELAIQNMQTAKKSQKLWYDLKAEKWEFGEEENINLLSLESSLIKEEDDEISKLESGIKDTELADIWRNIQSNTRLTADQKEKLSQLIKKYSGPFSTEPGCTNLAEHDIELDSDRPICARP
ncbi:retrovirus-related Pol polyprotein from transposon 412 [Trichonephila clavata]|uniref:Retrovirus-related Pol polyprotein from transposon 412 n=1 Tax=Trichonephila clavata TaxID=2740835 RepID=A0A8X6HCF0_TRICU|nr:retrovirus-related Pol polyprotein from transposon 412 [Trichonephila clavata]